MSSLKGRKAHSLWVVEGVRNAQEGCLASCLPAGRLCIQSQLPASINSSLRENIFLHPGMLSFIWVIALVKWHTGKKMILCSTLQTCSGSTYFCKMNTSSYFTSMFAIAIGYHSLMCKNTITQCNTHVIHNVIHMVWRSEIVPGERKAGGGWKERKGMLRFF